jgi:hypothetical protein
LVHQRTDLVGVCFGAEIGLWADADWLVLKTKNCGTPVVHRVQQLERNNADFNHTVHGLGEQA